MEACFFGEGKQRAWQFYCKFADRNKYDNCPYPIAMKHTLVLLALASFCLTAPAQDMLQTLDRPVLPTADTIKADTLQIDTLGGNARKASGFKRWWNNLVKGNVDRTHEKKVDISFVLSPSYTDVASVGIGGMCTAMFRTDRSDYTMPPSSISACASISVKKFYSFYLKGTIYFPDKRSQLDCYMDLRNEILDFWGFGFDNCRHNPQTKYSRYTSIIKADYFYSLPHNLYIGGSARFNYTDIYKLDNPDFYLSGQTLSNSYAGIGPALKYDSRDSQVTPQRGFHALIRPMYYRNLQGNGSKNVWGTTLQFNSYHRLWKNAVLATDLFAQLYDTDVNLPLMEQIAADYCHMRGYYIGRYADNNQTCVQVELRQNIYKRFGAVAWVGAGNFFRDFNHWQWSHTLPNGGVGLRFEFKPGINLRVDYGIGRGYSCIVFDFGEAF